MGSALSNLSYADCALYTGLCYLQTKVLYSLIVYDMPKDQQKALDYYTTRKEKDLSYKILPPFCLFLVGGVLGNVYQKGASVPSLITLAVTFMTMMNNGNNAVNPVIQLTKDKEAKGDKLDFQSTLNGVAKGHLIDAIGMTGIFLCHTYL